LIGDDWSTTEIATMNKLRHYLATELRKLSIADRIYAIVAALAILTTLLLAMSVQSVRLQTAHRNQLATSAKAALYVERVNGLVYSIVMESRGIYMSADPAKVKLYGDSVLRRNGELSKVMSEWQGTVDQDDAVQFADFKKRIGQFIDFRIELVRRAVEISPAAGREWGDDDASRVTRIALSDDLASFAKIYAERASRVTELGDQTRLASWYLATLGIGALLLAALNVLVVRRLVIEPLADITDATRSIAAGKVLLSIPHIARRDEIGRLAHAVQNFVEAIGRNLELEQRERGTAKQLYEALGERDTALEECEKLNDKYHAAKWQLSAAVNNISQGLVMLDSSSNVVLMNDQYRQIYRLPANLKVGCTLQDVLECRAKNGLLIGDVTEQLASIFMRIAKRVPSHHEVELGDGRVIRVNSRPMDGGGWISTHEDCTEEHRMQRVLERTERFLVTVIENVPEAIAAKDMRSLRYIFVNRAAETLFDLPRSAIIGKTARELFSQDLATMIELGDRDVLEGKEQLEPVVHVVETPRGRRLHAVRRIPVRGPDGESRVFLSVIEDRTDWAREVSDKILAA
jgi:PAS domain S-box-containing protein